MTLLKSSGGKNRKKLSQSCQWRWSHSLRLLAFTAAYTAWFVPLNRSTWSSVLPKYQYSHPDIRHYCSSNVGSLHSIAMDMIHYSSPPGSKSFNKLKSVLQAHSNFFVDLGPPIFQQNGENMAALLEGYGLKRVSERPGENGFDTLLVETLFSSSTCPLESNACLLRGRILIQVII